MAMSVRNKSLLTKKVQNQTKNRKEEEQKRAQAEKQKQEKTLERQEERMQKLDKLLPKKTQDQRPSYQQGTANNYYNPNMPTKTPAEILGKSAKSGDIWSGMPKRKSVNELLGEKAKGLTAKQRQNILDPFGQYGKGNIDLNNRKVKKNEDGSFSTEKSITVGFDDGTYLLPTIINGKEVSDEEAIRHYKKTGEHLGRFNSNTEADVYAEMLHRRQEEKYGNETPEEKQRRELWDSVHGAGSYNSIDRNSVRWDRMNAEIDQMLLQQKDQRPSYQQGTTNNYYNPNMPTRTAEEIAPVRKEYPKAENPQGYPHSYDMPPERPYKDYVGNVTIGGQTRTQTPYEYYESTDAKQRGGVADQLLGNRTYRNWLNGNPYQRWANLAEDREDWQNVQKDTELVIQEGYDKLQQALDEDLPGNPFYDNMIDEIKAGGLPDVISTPVRNEDNDRELFDFYYGDGFYDAWEGNPEREEKLQELWAPIEDGSLAAYRDKVEDFKTTQTETEYAQRMNRVAGKQIKEIDQKDKQKEAYNALIDQYGAEVQRPEWNKDYDRGYTDENVIRADVMSNDPSVNNDIDRIASFIGGGNEMTGYVKAFGDESGDFKIRNSYRYAMMMLDGSNGGYDEIGKFLELYNTAKSEGREPVEAQAFLDGLQPYLRDRYREAEQIDNAELARKYPVVASILSLGSHQLQTYLDIPRIVAHALGDKSTEDFNSWWYNGIRFSEDVEGTIAKDLGPKVGKIYSGVMNSASNLLRALAAPKGSKLAQSIGGLGGFFLQVQQESTGRNLENHSYEEASLIGTVDAIFEVLEEFLPFETMLGTAGTGMLTSMGINSFSELGQEFTGATVGEKIKGIILGEDPEVARADEIIAQQGYEKDGEWVDLSGLPKDQMMEAADIRSAHEFWTNAVEQGMGGAFGGFLGGTYGTIARATGMIKTGKTIRNEQNTVEGKTGGEQLVDVALGMKNTESQAQAEKIQEKQEAGKSVTNYEIGKLAATMAEETNAQIAQTVGETVENRIFRQLKDKGLSGTEAKEISGAMARGLTEGIKKADLETIAKSKEAIDLWKSYNTMASEDMAALREEVEEATAPMRSVADAIGDLTGRTAKAYGTFAEAVNVINRQAKDTGEALDMLGKYFRGVFSEAYVQEAKNVAESEKNQKTFLEDTAKIYLAAMTLNKAPKVRISEESASRLWKQAQAEFNANEEQRVLKQQKIVPGQGAATYDGAEYGTDDWQEKVNGNSDIHSRIKMQMNVLAETAKRMGMKLNFVNDGSQQGRLIHGWEETDGTISVNIAAMRWNGEAKNMMATFWHEFTHWLEQNSRNGYAQLRQFIVDGLRNTGVNVEARLLEIIDNQNTVLDAKSGESLDMTGAMAELVAQSCEELMNTKAIQAKLAEENPTLAGQVKSFVRKFIAQLNAALKGLKPSLSREAKALTQWKEQMAQMWLEAREEALGRTEEGAQAEGAQRFAIVDLNGNTVMMTQEKLEENKKAISNMAPVANIQENRFAKNPDQDMKTMGVNYFNSIGNIAKNKILGDVELNENGVQHLIKWLTKRRAGLLEAVKPVIENGEIIYIQEKGGRHNFDSATIAAPVMFEGDPYYMAVIIKQDGNRNNSYYFHDAILINKNVGAAPVNKSLTNQTLGADPTIVSVLATIPEYNGKNGISQGIRRSVVQMDEENKYESEYREAYERMTDLKLKLSELDGDLKDINKRIEAAKPEEHDALVQEIIAWDEKTGYGQLKKDYDQAKKDYEKAQKEWNKYLEERDEAEEQRKIQESGLTEAEWRRKEAVKQYGYTGDFREAGYLLPNGRLLNFCGSKGQHYGMRGNDHRDIGQIYANKQGSEAMVAFMADGNIRVMAESPGIDISTEKEPTSAQYTAIKNMAYKYAEDEYFNLDFTDKNGNNVGNIEYEGKINPSRIVNDIKYFFQTGNVREQSTVSMFHGNRWSVAQPDMEVKYFMLGLNENSMSTEQEKVMLRQFKELNTTADLMNHAIMKADEDIRKIQEKKELSAYDKREIDKLRIRKHNYQAKLERTMGQLARATKDEGFAKRMMQQESRMRNLVSGRTYNEVRQTVEALTQQIAEADKEIEARQKLIGQMRAGLRYMKAATLVDQDAVKKLAETLRKEYNSNADKQELIHSITEIRLKMAGGQNVSEDVADLAWRIASGTITDGGEQLRSLRGTTITLGAGQVKELLGKDSSLKELRDIFAGTGIKVTAAKDGEMGLDKDWEQLCAAVPSLDKNAKELAQVDELIKFVRNQKNEADSTKMYKGHMEEFQEDLAAMIATVGRQGAQDAETARTIKQMMDLIDRMGAGVEASQQEMQKAREKMSAVIEQGKLAMSQQDALQYDIDEAIKYNNALAQQSESVLWKAERKQLIEQLANENTEKLIAEQLKWKERIEKDKTARQMMSDNMQLRKEIHTNITRMKNLLMNETDLKNIPEHMKSLTREVLEKITNNDLTGRKITGIDRADLLEMRRVLEIMKGTDGEFSLDDLKMITDEEAQSMVEDALADIEDGIGFYNASSSGGIITTLQGFHNALDRIAEAVATIKNVIDAERTISIMDRKILVADAAEEIAYDMRNSRFKGETQGRGSRQINTAKRAVAWGNLTPVYFFRQLRNRGMMKQWQELARAENRNGLELQKASEFIEKIAEEADYKSWAGQKVQVNLGGRKMEITVDQIMSLYAIWRREKTVNPEMSFHLTNGGVFFQQEENTTGKLRKETTEQKPVKIDDDTVAALYGKLTEAQKKYLDKMVGYLSNEMSELGNEASMRMYGIKKYKEKWYFPMQVWDGVKSARSDRGISGTNENRAAHKSWSKRRINKASNALVIGDFTQTAVNHIVEMINYNTLAPAIENINKILNYQRNEQAVNDDPYGGSVKRNLRIMFQQAYGKQALEYLETFMKDLNGGAVQDQRKTLREAALSMFKKNAVAGSMSVALQQPLSYIRAAMMINPKYLMAAISPAYWKGSLEEMKKYSGVAVIKDMGRFDMNFGQSAKDYIAPDKKESIYAKVSDKLTILPEKMDQMTWTRMWTAAKLETSAKNPGMDMKSDEFLQKVAERFNEVMRATQVYDSVLVKSSNMRSQNYAMKVITSFMAEPTLSLNVLADATRNALTGEKGGKALLGKAVATFALSAAAQAFFKGLMGSGRTPDEKKTWEENFLYKWFSAFMSEINPFGLIPGYSDMVEVAKNGKLNDDAMGAIGKIFTTISTTRNVIQGNGKGWYRDLEDTAAQLAQLFTNVPAKNLMRDLRAMYNWVSQEPYAKRESSGAVKRFQIGEAAANADSLLGAVNTWLGDAGYKTTNKAYYQRMYDAQQRGDQAEAAAIGEYLKLAKGQDEDKIKSGVGTYGRADLWTAMDANKAEDIGAAIDMLKQAGYEPKAIKTNISSHYKQAYMAADSTGKRKIRDAMQKAYRKLGFTAQDADKTIENWEKKKN